MDVLAIRRLPYLTRRNFYYEFLHLIPWGFLAGAIEGNISAVVVAKTFHAGDTLIATASATPIAALLFNVVWGMLCVGRPKLRLATFCGAGAALVAATVAFVPHTRAGGVIFVVQMGISQIFLSGVVTVRSSLWKHNYPPKDRGRIAARLQALRMLLAVLMLSIMSAIFDMDPGYYRWIYPVAAVSGLFGLLILQRIHVRHERSDLAAIARGTESVERMNLLSAVSPKTVLTNMSRILHADPRFAHYLAAQMVFGFGVQMVIPVLVIVVRDAFQTYWASAMLIIIIPKLFIFASLPRWGRLYDRISVSRFRVYIGLCAAGGILVGMFAVIAVSTTSSRSDDTLFSAGAVLFTLRAIMQGLHQGGGSLAWNLGHLHFSKRNDAEVYMGVHVTLTGLRGVIAPFAGVALAASIGWGVWAVAFVLALVGVYGFHRLTLTDDANPTHV